MMDLYKIRSLLINGKTIFDVPLRVVYYARVSTDKDEQLNSLKNQVQYYEEYINKNKNWILVDKYIDEGISATTTKGRISFLKMIDDAKLDQFDLIITKEISRFSRNTLDSLKYTQNLLQSGVGVYFEYDDINTLEPDSELRLTIMASIAQEEVRKLSERVKFGQKRAMKNGILFGRNNIFGYNKVGNDLCIKEDEAVIVRQIFNTYVEGKLGLRRIARDLEKQGIVDSKGKMISYGSLHHMITNPKYKGFYCGRKTSTEDYRYKKTIRINKEDWIVYKDNNIPAIVSEDVWDRANAILEQRGKKFKENAQAYQNRYPYSGKLICGEHGTTYHRHVNKNNKAGEEREIWNCKLYRLKGKKEGCDSPTIYTKELDEIMSHIYQTLFDNKDEVIKGLLKAYRTNHLERDFANETEMLCSKIHDVTERKDELLELSVNGEIDNKEFGRRNDRLNTELEELNKEMRAVKEEELSEDFKLKEIKELQIKLDKMWDDSLNGNGILPTTLLDRIVVHKTSDKGILDLEVFLKTGHTVPTHVLREKHESCSILLYDVGISQAQVSRLEKNALKNMKRNI